MQTFWILALLSVATANGLNEKWSDSSDSEASSEELPMSVQRVRVEPPKNKLKKFEKKLQRPSVEELEEYDRKVKEQQQQEMGNSESDSAKVDMIMKALNQMYIQEGLDYEDGAPMEPIPFGMEDPNKPNSNNNNNNVHLSVNHVNVHSTMLGLPGKGDAPAPPMPFPIETTYYVNLNMTDFLILAALLCGLIYLIRKAYKRCFAAPKSAAPPTYPQSVVVESVSRKVAPQ